MELNIPAIKGIGDSLIYFVDRWRGKNGAKPAHRQHRHLRRRLRAIPGADREPGRPRPHLHRPPDAQRAPRPHEGMGRLLREACSTSAKMRYFDIEGKVTGVKSKAMTSPCGKIRIPINEEGSDDKPARSRNTSTLYHGEGIQHIALGSTTSTPARSTA
jgi:4-hydroxyphenylpyruvate dioxygenase